MPDTDMTEAEVRRMLKREVATARSIAAWAAEHGVTPAYLGRAMAGKTTLGPAILRALGVERVVTYRRRGRK